MNSDIELFPYLLLRVAGGQYEDFQKTELKETLNLVIMLQRKEEEANELKEPLTDQLYTYIPTVEPTRTRQTLINLRRDIHNNRPVSSISNQIHDQLPSHLKRMLARYLNLTAEITSLKKQGERTYQEEVKQSKQAFAVLLRQPNLQNGLLLSSATIMESLKKYLEADHTMTPVVSQKERSFMEYLSRMYVKPTPFGTFTQLGIASFGSKESKSLLSPTKAVGISSRIQLNHALYQYITEFMMQQPEIRRYLQIVPNFTIRKVEKQFTFLTNSHNKESFQFIESTPSLELFYALTYSTDELWKYQDLVHAIMAKSNYTATAEKDIEAYIDHLLAIGFFEFSIGVSGKDRNWASKLAKRVSNFEQSRLCMALTRDLMTLQALTSQYAISDVTQREKLLYQAYRLLKSNYEVPHLPEKQNSSEKVFRHTYEDNFTLKPNELWYEDTFLDQQLSLTPRLKAPLDTLGDLLARTGSLDGCLDEKDAMAHFFRTTYGEKARISLLQFYKEYSKHTKASEGNHVANSLTKVRHATQQKALRSFMRLVKDQLNCDEIDLTKRHLPNLPAAPASSSFAAFFHVYNKTQKPTIVVNNTVPGHGRMFSRFLYLFGDMVTDELRRETTGPKDDVLMAEATDTSVSNANLHERIMPYEIYTPGGQTTLSSQSQLRVDELEVSYSTADHRLLLTHITRKCEVAVFDLDFQTPARRSGLYNLLISFNFGSHHNISFLTNYINEHLIRKIPAQNIQVFPRIIYEDSVIIQRKSWRIPKKHLPKRQTQESAWEYFLKLQSWTKQLGLPAEVFVKLGFDKPQYISFHNPLLVALFASLVDTCDTDLQIEEMSPNSSQLLTINGGARAVEFLCQWHVKDDDC